MRRAAAVVFVLGLIGAWLALSGAGGTTGNYRIDAIFDNASFLIPGQDVKIAGARVGTVKAVKLTPDNKARIQMEIDPRFTPFHADADCTIQPQSLIGEKFIQCSPGTPRAGALVAQDGEAPTVPLSGTHSPVDLDLVFSTFRRPTNERLGLIISELGAGLAGRGADLNAAIRRANPALQETNRVLKIVSDDRVRVGRLIAASHDVLAKLATRRKSAAAFIDAANRVTKTTAAHRASLKATVKGLPALLAQAQPALQSLQQLAEQATPIVRNLHSAAPQLTRLGRDFGPLATAARPALVRLGTASAAGQTALRAATPVVGRLRRFAKAAAPTSDLVVQLFDSLRKTGTSEGLINFVYYATLATSRFDATSHMLPAHVLGSSCGQYSTTTVTECDAHFATSGVAAAAKSKRTTPAKSHQKSKPAAPAAPAPTAPASKAPGTIGQGLTLNLPGLPPIKLPGLGRLGGLLGGGKASGSAGQDNGVRDLLGYLLG